MDLICLLIGRCGDLFCKDTLALFVLPSTGHCKMAPAWSCGKENTVGPGSRKSKPLASGLVCSPGCSPGTPDSCSPLKPLSIPVLLLILAVDSNQTSNSHLLPQSALLSLVSVLWASRITPISLSSSSRHPVTHLAISTSINPPWIHPLLYISPGPFIFHLNNCNYILTISLPICLPPIL